MLPQNQNLWQYNRKELRDVKPILTEFTKNYLEKYHKEDLEKFKNISKNFEKISTKLFKENNVNSDILNKRLENLNITISKKILYKLKSEEYIKQTRKQNIKNNFHKLKTGVNLLNRLHKLTEKDINQQIINVKENLKLQSKIKFKEKENEINL